MNTIIDPAISANEKLSELVKQATPLLEEGIGEAAGRATAEWSLATDNLHRPVLVLALSDYLGLAKGLFTINEMKDAERLLTRFIRLWGDVLQVGSKKQLQRLKQLVLELEGD